MDLERYFDRIGHRLPHERTATVLHALTQAHVQSIPFENIDVFLGRPIRLEPDALYHKLVSSRRGGYCFEQNGLFLEVLGRLGFQVRPLRAAVRLGEPDRRVPVRHTHLVLEVRINDEPWITDVGVGSASLTRALRLAADVEQPTPHGTRRLQRQGGKWFHQVRHGDTWVDVYEFDGSAMLLPDRVVANWYTSTSPDSRFRRELGMAKALPEGRWVSLRGHELTLRGADGSAKKELITGSQHLFDVLHRYFGIDLAKNTQLELIAATDDPAR